MKSILPLPALAILLVMVAAGPLPAAAADAPAPAAIPAAELRLGQKLLAVDLADYRDARKLDGDAREGLRLAIERLDQALAGDAVSLGSIETLHRNVASAQISVRLSEARLEQVLARLEDRLRMISFLERESAAAAAKPAGSGDPIAGVWKMEIQPQGGVATLTLGRAGAIVSGHLDLAGGSSAGVRGTFSNNGLRLERLDATGEVEATFLGTLDPASGRLRGEWRASRLTEGKPATGSWSAERTSNTG